jgi:hypothetical protein
MSSPTGSDNRVLQESNNNTIYNNTSIIDTPVNVDDIFNYKAYIDNNLKLDEMRNVPRAFALKYLKEKGLVFKDKRSLEASVRAWMWAGKQLAEYMGDKTKLAKAWEEAKYYLSKDGQRVDVDWDLRHVLNKIRKI